MLLMPLMLLAHVINTDTTLILTCMSHIMTHEADTDTCANTGMCQL